MASLAPEAVMETVTAEEEITHSLGSLKVETMIPAETKDAENSVKEDEAPHAPAEEAIPDARLLETSIFVGEYLPYTPLANGEDDARPFDVVFVHGLNKGFEASVDTWGDNKLGTALHEKYPKSRIINCNYLSDDPRLSPFNMNGLRSHAMEILNDLLDWCKRKEMEEDGVRPLVFVAHDIGGIIVKLALWIASLDYGRYKNVLDSTRALIFIGCPHRSSTPQNLEDMVANLIYTTTSTRLIRASHNIQSLANVITEINGYFELTNLASLLEIVSIYSEEMDPVLRIFDKHAAIFGLPFEERIGYNKPHKDLAKEIDVEKIFPVINRVLSTYPGKPDDHSMESMRTFHNLASRGARVQPLVQTDERFKWVTEHKFFNTWLASYGTALLYVFGKTRIPEVSDHILQSLDEFNAAKTKAKDIILTYRFEKHNVQYSSVVEMLTSLLAQVFKHRQAMTDFLVFEQMQHYHSWTQTELLILFKTVLGHNDHEGIIVVISCVDQCDDSITIFLQDLCRFLTLTEHRIKILITGVMDHDIGGILAGHQSIALEESIAANQEAFVLSDVKHKIEELMQYEPNFAKSQLLLRDYLKPFAHDSKWLQLMTTHLGHNPDLVGSPMSALAPATLADSITRILKTVPVKHHGWARKAILWIVYAFRPLKTWELETALALEFDDLASSNEQIDEFVYSSTGSKLGELFQGLFIIENHEIRLGHPEIRDFFLSRRTNDCWYNVATGEKEILEACTFYFTLPQVQEAISKRYLHQPREAHQTTFPESFDEHYFPGENLYHHYNFCSYATLFWPEHYKFVPEESRMDIVKPFLENKKAVRTWSEAHWWLSNCIRRSTRSFLSDTHLPVFAGLGLLDLLVLSDEVEVKDRAFALSEAARNGHIDIVRILLKYDDYSEEDLIDALQAGSCCETNEQLITELVTYATNTVKQDVIHVEPKTPVQGPAIDGTKLIGVEEGEPCETLDESRPATSETSNEEDSPPGLEESNTNAAKHIAAETDAKEVEGTTEEPEKKVFPFPSSTICRAVAFSHENLTRKLLELGVSVQATTVQTMTPLDFAVRQRNPAILKLLLEYKAEIGLGKTLAYHPLHLAVIYGMPEMVQQLIDANIDLDLKNTSDSTATYLGCWHRHHKAVEPIIKAKADLNNNTRGVWTPLTACARRDTRICAKLLLDHGANVEVVGFNDWTPLRSATVQGYVEFSKLLLDYKADPNTTSGAKGAPIICEVARQGNLELVKLLVENGATVTAADFNASTAVLNAGVCGKTDVVEYLFDHGANVLDEDVTGFNTISLAAYSSFPTTIEMAAKKGVDIHNESKTKWTPIHYAYDDAETSRVLMELGADPNRIAEFYTPLILTATFNKPETTKVLLKYKPNLEITSDNPELNPGLTALGIAVTNGHLEVAKEILEAGANVNHKAVNRSFPLEYPVRDDNLPMLKLLLEYNPDVTMVDQGGNTALHCVTITSNLDIARALVNAGAPLNTINKKGYTPLGEALNEYNLPITKYLIEKKSPLNTIGGEVGGPLHLASRNCAFEFITLLVAAGADINSLDPCLGTPLQAACSRWAKSDDTAQTFLREKILKYFIEELKVDIHIEGGDYGCALNAICAFSTPAIINLALDRKARIDISDRMGRQAIHFAALNSLEIFDLIHKAGTDLDAKDLCGRTILHWAIIGGNVDVIERVLDLNPSLLENRDADGWTPLLWACRGAGMAMNEQTPTIQKEVIETLLKRGADASVIASGGGGGREWSILSVARYNGGENAALMPWLMEKCKKKFESDDAGGEGVWNEKVAVHQSRVGMVRSSYCDSCLMTIGGLRYRCKTCLNHDFCGKCYESIKIFHDTTHVFDEGGPEFVADEKEEKKGESKDDDSGASETGGNEDGEVGKKNKDVSDDGEVVDGESEGIDNDEDDVEEGGNGEGAEIDSDQNSVEGDGDEDGDEVDEIEGDNSDGSDNEYAH